MFCSNYTIYRFLSEYVLFHEYFFILNCICDFKGSSNSFNIGLSFYYWDYYKRLDLASCMGRLKKITCKNPASKMFQTVYNTIQSSRMCRNVQKCTQASTLVRYEHGHCLHNCMLQIEHSSDLTKVF